MSSRKDRSPPTPPEPGRLAQAGNVELRSYDVGALPLINHLLEKMRLEEFLSKRLPPDDPRAELPTAQRVDGHGPQRARLAPADLRRR